MNILEIKVNNKLRRKSEVIKNGEFYITKIDIIKNNKAITLIALVITIIFSYDENVKSSNNKGFLLESI